MLALIMSQPVELHVNTVSLKKESNNDVKLFRCVSCSSPVVQYEGSVVKIRPHLESSEEALIMHKCHHCPELYSFLTTDYLNDSTDVVLNRRALAFHCFICRQVLVEVNGEYVTDLRIRKNYSPPFVLKCINASCPANYLFSDIVDGAII